MKKFLLVIGVLLVLLSTGCSNKYEGYWCRYNETSTIVVLLDKDVTAKERTKIKSTLDGLENIYTITHFTRDEYAREIGKDVKDLDIYETYILSFDSVDYIGDYVNTLSKMAGVYEAKEVQAKNNMALYNLLDDGTYTYAESDDALEGELVKGKYKIKDNMIVFTPNDNKDKSYIYIKNEHLCADADCEKIFARSDSSCNAK